MSNDEDETLFSESLLEGDDEDELADEKAKKTRNI